MTESVKETQALAKRAFVEGEIVDAQAYNAKVHEWREQGFNVLTPAVALSTIPRDHRVVVNRVAIDPNPLAGEVYQNPLFCKNGEVALSKVGLEKVAQCAGISITSSRRTDSQTVPYIWSYEVRGHWTGFDGAKIDRIANKTLDLRDGSADIKGFTANQIEQARRHGEAVCESKAINRLYRMYGLRQKYTQRELLERPFIVLKLRWEPDESNPVVAAIVTQMRMGATALMYPHSMPALPSGFDLATAPQHMVPPELRPSTLEVIPDTDDDIPMGEPVATPRTREPLFTITDLRKEVDGVGYYLTTKETGDEHLHIDDLALAKKAQGAQSLAMPVGLTFGKHGTGRSVTALRLGDHD